MKTNRSRNGSLWQAVSLEEMKAFFFANLLPNELTGCLEWQRAKMNRGYGVTQWRGRHWLAHRMAWFLVRGPIPPGWKLVHVGPSLSSVDRCVPVGLFEWRSA